MKDGLPNQWKFCMFFERSLSGSWGQHGTKILPKWCPVGWWKCSLFSGLEGSWGVLGPLEPQEAPRADFNRFLIDFRWILVDFWRIFEWFFNDFCDGCHPCLIPQVIMNVLNFLLYVSLCMIFQWLLWWLSSLFDIAAHHECFNFCVSASVCVFLVIDVVVRWGQRSLEQGCYPPQR